VTYARPVGNFPNSRSTGSLGVGVEGGSLTSEGNAGEQHGAICRPGLTVPQRAQDGLLNLV
jgi:hypothetical protein